MSKKEKPQLESDANDAQEFNPGRKFGAAATVNELLAGSNPNQRAVLYLLALSNHEDLAAAQLFRNFAPETKKKFRWQLNELANLIDAGNSPLDALADERLNRLVTPPALLALQLAKDEGSLPILYKEIGHANQPGIVIPDDDDALTRVSSLIQRWVIALWIFTLVLLKIVPEFMMMLQEFGAEMPQAFKSLITFADLAVKFWFVGFIVFIPVAIWIGKWYWRSFWPSTWQTRPVSKAVKKRTALSVGIQSAPNVPGLIGTLRKFRPLKKYAKKFEKAHIRVGQGEEGWEALAKEKLVTNRESRILTMSESRETQSWLLRWFSSSAMNRREAISGGFANVLIILGNIALAVLVLATALTIFSSLLALMESAGQ